jgi:hypothetical protein
MMKNNIPKYIDLPQAAREAALNQVRETLRNPRHAKVIESLQASRRSNILTFDDIESSILKKIFKSSLEQEALLSWLFERSRDSKALDISLLIAEFCPQSGEAEKREHKGVVVREERGRRQYDAEFKVEDDSKQAATEVKASQGGKPDQKPRSTGQGMGAEAANSGKTKPTGDHIEKDKQEKPGKGLIAEATHEAAKATAEEKARLEKEQAEQEERKRKEQLAQAEKKRLAEEEAEKERKRKEAEAELERKKKEEEAENDKKRKAAEEAAKQLKLKEEEEKKKKKEDEDKDRKQKEAADLERKKKEEEAEQDRKKKAEEEAAKLHKQKEEEDKKKRKEDEEKEKKQKEAAELEKKKKEEEAEKERKKKAEEEAAQKKAAEEKEKQRLAEIEAEKEKKRLEEEQKKIAEKKKAEEEALKEKKRKEEEAEKARLKKIQEEEAEKERARIAKQEEEHKKLEQQMKNEKNNKDNKKYAKNIDDFLDDFGDQGDEFEANDAQNGKEAVKEPSKQNQAQEDKELEGAATKIQAVYRGKQERSKVDALKKEKEEQEKARAQEQKLKEAEKKRIEEENARKKQQEAEAAKNEVDDIEYLDNDPGVKDATVKIQAAFRGKQDRKKVEDLKKEQAVKPPAPKPAEVKKPEPPKKDENFFDDDDFGLLDDTKGQKNEASVKEAKKEPSEENFDELVNDPGVEGAAVKIQSAFRGKKDRAKVEELKKQQPAQPPKKADAKPTEQPSTQKAPKKPDIDLFDDEEFGLETNQQSNAKGQPAMSQKEELEQLAKEPGMEDAALKIQSAYRGKQDRKKVEQLKNDKDFEVKAQENRSKDDHRKNLPNIIVTPEAANNPKNYVVEMPKEAPKPKQEEKEDFTELDNDPDVEKAATKIQASFRGKQDRAKVEQRKEEEKKAAEKKRAEDEQRKKEEEIQRAKKLKEEEEKKRLAREKAELDAAAIKIQARYRGNKDRNQISEMKKVKAQVKDKTYDDVFNKKVTKEQEDAARKIQSVYRGNKDRQRVKLMKVEGVKNKPVSKDNSNRHLEQELADHHEDQFDEVEAIPGRVDIILNQLFINEDIQLQEDYVVTVLVKAGEFSKLLLNHRVQNESHYQPAEG